MVIHLAAICQTDKERPETAVFAPKRAIGIAALRILGFPFVKYCAKIEAVCNRWKDTNAKGEKWRIRTKRHMKTRAAIVYATNQPVVVEDIELDPPKSGEVMVKLAASGVCHSDLAVANGSQRHLLPEVLGHEGAGVVVEVGQGVSAVKPGDRVMLSFVPACGRCSYCTTGRPNLCATHFGSPRGTLLDGTCRFHKGEQRCHHMSRLGTMTEYTVVQADALIPATEGVPLDKAALIGCAVTTGVGAVVHTAKVEPGGWVAVIGAGGVGLNVVLGAALVGAEKIIAVDVVQRKLEFAKQFGATHTVDASTEDPVEAVKSLTNGEGVHYAFEAIGNPRTIEQAFYMLRMGGAAVVIGIAHPDAKISIPAALFPYGERRLVGSFYGSAQMRVDMPRLLNLYRAGKLKLDELATKTYSIDQVNEAFDDMKAGLNIRGVILFDEKQSV
jgi:S-(hydroxymethyl)glutathione dehydrogenase/alcohol dehydrogenase